MNSIPINESTIFVENFTNITIESWFIPLSITMISCITLSIILSILFLIIILFEKQCHKVSMILIGNSCLTGLIYGCDILSMYVFTLLNDLKEIQHKDSLCVFRGYLFYASGSTVNYSYVLQAFYRYFTTVYPNNLFWRSVKSQFLLICLTWIFGYGHSFIYLFTGTIIYNIDNQICQIPLRPSFSLLFGAIVIYIIPTLTVMVIYSKLLRHVRRISRNATPENYLLHYQQELVMVRRTIIFSAFIIVVCSPYTIFMFMCFFNAAPKYHFRIAYTSVNASLLFSMIAILSVTSPLKLGIMKRLTWRPNTVGVM